MTEGKKMILGALTLNLIIFGLLVVILARGGYLNLYSGLLVYILFHFMVFVQRPFVVYLFDLRSEFASMQFWPTQDQFLKTLLVANIGLFSFVGGYLGILRGKRLRPAFERFKITESEKNAFLAAFAILSPLILYSFYLAFTMRQEYGAEALDELGRINMTIDPFTGFHLFQDTTAYVVLARNMALPFALIVILLYRGSWWSFLPLAFCAAVALQTGERWPLVISCMAGISASLYVRGRKTITLRECLIGVISLAVFVALGQNRELLVKFLLTGNVRLHFDLVNSSFGDHPDFANFEFLSFIIGKVPDVSKTWSYFTQYLGLFTQPIPRILWPDKPVGSPVILVNLQQYGRWGARTQSLVGDGWISLGYIGVIATLSSAGAAYGALYRRFCAPNLSIYFGCAYFWIDALLLQWARDGGYRIADFLFFCTGPIVLAFFLARFFAGSPDRTRPLRRFPQPQKRG